MDSCLFSSAASWQHATHLAACLLKSHWLMWHGHPWGCRVQQCRDKRNKIVPVFPALNATVGQIGEDNESFEFKQTSYDICAHALHRDKVRRCFIPPYQFSWKAEALIPFLSDKPHRSEGALMTIHNINKVKRFPMPGGEKVWHGGYTLSQRWERLSNQPLRILFRRRINIV